MNMLKLMMTNPTDHIMANTWRLIFERTSRRPTTNQAEPRTDFTLLEQLLPEYRLIGLCLAEEKTDRPN
jgi:hypothetical protein